MRPSIPSLRRRGGKSPRLLILLLLVGFVMAGCSDEGVGPGDDDRTIAVSGEVRAPATEGDGSAGTSDRADPAPTAPPLEGEAPVADAEVRIYDLDEYAAGPDAATPLASTTTDGEGRYRVEDLPRGNDLLVVVGTDPRLTSIVHEADENATGDVNTATTLAAERWAPDLLDGATLPEDDFEETVEAAETALQEKPGEELDGLLDLLVPPELGDGFPELLPPAAQFLVDVLSGADPAVCEALELEEDAATPTTRVPVTGLSEALGQDPGVWIYDAEVEELVPDERRPGYVERDVDEEGLFFTPVHPTDWMDGGEIQVAIFAEDESLTCPGLDLEVLPLEPAPGTMEATVDALVEDARQFAEDAGYDPQQLLETDVRELDPWIRGIATHLQILEGPNNPNNVRNLLTGEAPALDGVEVEEELNDLLDALAAESGLSEALREGSTRMAELASVLEGERPVEAAARPSDGPTEVSGNAGSDPIVDLEPPNQPVTPQTLDRLMTIQSGFAAVNGGAYGEWLEFSTIATGTISVALTATLVGAPAGAQVGVASNVLTGIGIALDFGESMLPSTLQDIELQPSPASFDEDSEDGGQWEAPVAALTGEWSLKVPDVLGVMPIGGGAMKVLGRMGQFSDEVLDFGKHVLEAQKGWIQQVWGVSSDSGPLQIGRHPYNVQGGVTPERAGEDDYFSWQFRTDWSETGIDPLGLVHGSESRYKPRDVGAADLRVRTEPGRFADQFRESIERIRVEAIDVNIVDQGGAEPPFQVSPGEEIGLFAEVENAQDTTVEWSAGAGELISVGGESNQKASYRAPEEPGSYRVTAESIAEGGLRADREPPRLDRAWVFVGDFSVSPSPPCVEVGETVAFSATIGGEELPDDQVSATVVQGSGSITDDGVYTAGSEGEVTIVFEYLPPGADEPLTREVSFQVREFCSYWKVETETFDHTSFCVFGHGDMGGGTPSTIVNTYLPDEPVLLQILDHSGSLAQEGEWEVELVRNATVLEWQVGFELEQGDVQWFGPTYDVYDDQPIGSQILTVRREIRELGGQEVALFSGSFTNVGFTDALHHSVPIDIDDVMFGSGTFRGVPDLEHDPAPPEEYICPDG